MYKSISLPNTGVGVMAAASVSPSMMWALTIVATYTILMAGVTLWKLRPVVEA